MNKLEKQWWKNSVVYQVYPKSFKDSNGDGIGDIQGIVSELPYLSKLGVDVIWLNPIYKSPMVDNGYDISDYYQINPQFGNLEDFKQLLHAAHQLNLKIILDLVVNHTSDQHKWFKESRKSKNNPYSDYYIWKDPNPDGTPPNNWGSSFGGPAWEYAPERGQYYLHLFAKEQPDLNWENKNVRQDVYRIMKYWLELGIDGFRMDVISLISKDPTFPDGPLIQNKSYGNYYIGASNGPKVHQYLQEMYRETLAHYNVMTVGETAHTNSQQAVLYTASQRHELNMVFQFDHMHLSYGVDGKFSNKRFNLVDLKRVLSEWQEVMIKNDGWNSLYWSNHDQPRAVTRFGNDQPEWSDKSAKMLGTILHMQCGTPFIYQGEELGMTNAKFKDINDYRDIETHNIYEDFINNKHYSKEYTLKTIYLNSRDNGRTPIPWNENGGFSTGKPWIDYNPNYSHINAEDNLKDPDSVFYYYQKLIRLRHEIPIITEGDYQLLDPDNPFTYTYLRETSTQYLFVTGNFTADKQEIKVPSKLHFKNSRLLINNYQFDQQLGKQVELPPYGAAVYILDK
ncbi:glycoside hydrolase family 13 protein [Lactobacillus huangpiensis]|nr:MULTISPECIES: alpha-glucosidase [Lactobacillus]MBI0033974.1 alpha-glucosidase [Lactobacillus sp. M0396]